MPAIKLADLGVAHRISETHLFGEVWGTPGYLSPEVLRGSANGAALDMWSVGVVLYVMLCGGFPFHFPEASPDEDYETLESGGFDRVAFPSPQWDGVPEEAIHLVKGLLTTEEAQRTTASQALQHAWLGGTGAALDGSRVSRMRRGVRAVGSALVTRARRATTSMLSVGVIADGKPSTRGAREPLAPLDNDASNGRSAMPYTPMVV